MFIMNLGFWLHNTDLYTQGISLTGLGTMTFKKAIAAVKNIHSQFDRQFTEKVLESWTPSTVGEAEMQCMDTSNRYFTLKIEAQGMEVLNFLPGIDPCGFL